jgi:hypothetical protein
MQTQVAVRETVNGLSKAEAENLLDWLEAHGCQEREVICEEGRAFTVRYAPALGRTKGADERKLARPLVISSPTQRA